MTDKPITTTVVWQTEAQKRHIQKAAERAGLGMSAFIRTKIIEAVRAEGTR